jgi:FKBP-type peptidyl-prolyl cis-trans isomerase FkpA
MTSRRPFASAALRTHIVLRTASLCAVAGLLAGSPAAAEVEVESEQDKAIYLIGVSFARQLGPLYLSDHEVEVIARGLREAHAGSAMDLDPQVYGPKIGLLQEDRAKKGLAIESEKSIAYLAKQRKEEGAKVTDSGLIITEVSTGGGAQPTAEQKVRVHYTGRLRDGTVFDSSVQRGEPMEFPLSGVIPCWTEGVGMMKVGGKAKLVCPSEIAYGERGAPPSIPPGAALTFDVELLAIVE